MHRIIVTSGVIMQLRECTSRLGHLRYFEGTVRAHAFIIQTVSESCQIPHVGRLHWSEPHCKLSSHRKLFRSRSTSTLRARRPLRHSHCRSLWRSQQLAHILQFRVWGGNLFPLLLALTTLPPHTHSAIHPCTHVLWEARQSVSLHPS